MAKRRIYLTEAQLKTLIDEGVKELIDDNHYKEKSSSIMKEQVNFTDLQQNLYLYKSYLEEEYMCRCSHYWFSDKQLVESRGDVPQIYALVDKLYKEIYEIAEYYNEEFQSKGELHLNSGELDVGENDFIVEPRIELWFKYAEKNQLEKAAYLPNLRNTLVQNKVYRPTYVYYQYTNSGLPDYEIFTKAMSHELMHTYRHFSVCKRNSNLPYGEILSKERMLNTRQNPSDDELTAFIKRIVYLMEQDELNAESAALSTYLKQHKEINYVNYESYMESMPLYKSYNILSFALMKLSFAKSNEDKEKYGNIVRNIMYWGNVTPLKAFNLFQKKIERACSYALQQFYKILWNVFSTENREVVGENFQLLREWAKENGYGRRERYGKIIRKP